MRIKHYDLFAGIGGFSYALDTIFHDHDIEHIFCEWEAFPTAVLKKHWPNETYYGDIADLVADTERQRLERSQQDDATGHIGQRSRERSDQTQVLATTLADTDHARSGTPRRGTDGNREKEDQRWKGQPQSGAGGYRKASPDTDSKRPRKHSERERLQFEALGTQNGLGKELIILTGGFPCQPFSHAGRRKGTNDERYKWPEMFAVIRNVRPDWVIAENVRGLASWNNGMVLETVCTDLEAEGYEVRPYIIPACAVGAPHRRDRIWIAANRTSKGLERSAGTELQGGSKRLAGNDAWNKDWREVALATCNDSMDDGLPRRLDGATCRGKRTDTISASQHRKEQLKAYGNAIVPQVAMELFKAIRLSIYPPHND